MKLKDFLIGGVVIAAALAGCGKPGVVTQTGGAAGMAFAIVAVTNGFSKSAAQNLVKEAEDLLEARAEMAAGAKGTVADLNESRSAASLPDDLARLFVAAESLRTALNGAYDYRIGGIKDAWRLNEKKPQRPTDEVLVAEREKAQATKLFMDGGAARLEGGGRLDFGGLALGWAVDGAADLLIKGGVPKGMVSLGNVTRVWGGLQSGGEPWKVEVEPWGHDSTAYVVQPEEGAVAAVHSGLNDFMIGERSYPRTLDPRTGEPSDSARITAVWTPQAMLSGAYAEAFHAMGRRGAFTWAESHQPVGIFMNYNDPVDNSVIVETDPIMTPMVTEKLREED